MINDVPHSRATTSGARAPHVAHGDQRPVAVLRRGFHDSGTLLRRPDRTEHLLHTSSHHFPPHTRTRTRPRASRRPARAAAHRAASLRARRALTRAPPLPAALGLASLARLLPPTRHTSALTRTRHGPQTPGHAPHPRASTAISLLSLTPRTSLPSAAAAAPTEKHAPAPPACFRDRALYYPA